MADILIHTGRFNADTSAAILERWHDNGDGTYSPYAYQLGASGALYDGTQTVTTAAALNGGTSQTCGEVTVQNDPSNSVDIYVGNATSQSWRLQPGQTYTLSVGNVNLVYVKAVSGSARVNWQGRS